MKPKPIIRHVPVTEGTPVLPFIVDAYVALRKARNIDAQACPVSGAEEAFYATNKAGKVVAVLSFFVSEPDTWTVNMGFVSKRYRRRGLYAVLWARLVAEARTRSIKTVLGYHKPGNTDILAFNAKVGRNLKYVCSEYTV